MDEYVDDSDVIVICKAVLTLIAYYGMRTMSTIIEIELEKDELARLPLRPMFTSARSL